MKKINAVLRYFDLSSERPADLAEAQAKGGTPAPSTGWLIALFFSVLLGVVGKAFVDSYDQKLNRLAPGFWSLRLVGSVIVTAVIFPAVYKQTLDKSELPPLVQCCIALGGGFGYKALIDIGK